jgi:serine/threonine-protein kinase RsbW
MIALMERQKLHIPSKPESINIVENLIDKIKDQLKICEDCYGNMLVAVTEAVNNAIYHGNKSDPSKKVDIGYECSPEKVAFYISDEGSGFDYYNLPDPTAPENLEKPCGRGIFLMKHLSDQIIFNDNGRVVELYFNIKKSA